MSCTIFSKNGALQFKNMLGGQKGRGGIKNNLKEERKGRQREGERKGGIEERKKKEETKEKQKGKKKRDHVIA